MAAVNVPIVADENVPFRGGDEPQSVGGQRRPNRSLDGGCPDFGSVGPTRVDSSALYVHARDPRAPRSMDSRRFPRAALSGFHVPPE